MGALCGILPVYVETDSNLEMLPLTYVITNSKRTNFHVGKLAVVYFFRQGRRSRVCLDRSKTFSFKKNFHGKQFSLEDLKKFEFSFVWLDGKLWRKKN